ncbi:protein FAM177A1-like [Patiria miniata]|uniref:Protein FAM177A1 n=1 Tax=Patiria miniata TaxID=46514 RepID=A0A914BIM3_PATMI|nr:protein FAM177A1-like [Patiria miniata]
MDESVLSQPKTSATASILLQEEPAKTSATAPDNVTVGIRKPKRVIHFSDGVVEEYSSDEDDESKKALAEPTTDPKTMTWLPYLWYYTVVAATKTVGACDFMGEKLAYFLGITSPKYQFAINEYNRLNEEEKKALDQEQEEKECQRERIAMMQANRVYAETTVPYSAANPGLGTDL